MSTADAGRLTHQQIAEELADLIVDAAQERDRDGLLGEAEKALAYLRATGDPDQLALLLALRADRGQPFAQTRNIPLYYQLLYGAVRALRRAHPELDGAAITVVLSWAVRLARYRHRAGAPPLGRGGLALTPEDQRLPPRAPRRPPPAPARPQGPELPAVGEEVTFKILEIDERAALLEVAGFTVDKAVAILKTENMEGKTFRIGNTARVRVLAHRPTKSGRIIVDVKAVPRGDE